MIARERSLEEEANNKYVKIKMKLCRENKLLHIGYSVILHQISQNLKK